MSRLAKRLSRLEELQKAVYDAREELQKASDAWATYDADAVWAAYVAAGLAFCEAREKLEDYKKEHKL